MRILHVAASVSPEWGGPVAVIYGLLPALRNRGVSSTVIAPIGKRVGTEPINLESADLQIFPTGTLARGWTGSCVM